MKRIEVFRATLDSKCIRFYSNQHPNWCCEGEIIRNTFVKTLWKEGTEEIIQQSKGNSSFQWINGYRMAMIISCFITYFGMCFYYGKLVNKIILIIVCLQVGTYVLTTEIVKILLEFFSVKATLTFNYKSKHTAQHKIIHYIEKLQKLPNDIKQIKKMSRFEKACGYEEEKKRYKEYANNILKAFSIFSILIFVFFIEENTGIFLLLLSYWVIRFLLYRTVLSPLSTILNIFFQLASTTRKPDEKDLMLAWIVAKEWMKEEYPEYFQED